MGQKRSISQTGPEPKDLIAKIEVLEQKLFDLAEENKDLRLLIRRL